MAAEYTGFCMRDTCGPLGYIWGYTGVTPSQGVYTGYGWILQLGSVRVIGACTAVQRQYSLVPIALYGGLCRPGVYHDPICWTRFRLLRNGTRAHGFRPMRRRGFSLVWREGELRWHQ